MSILKVGEVGKVIQMGSGGFDLSTNTDLQIQFTKPDKTQLIVTISDGVTAPAVQTIVDVNSVSTTFEANEYWEYPFAPGDLDQSGTWVANGIYIDATPKDFCGDPFVFTVLPC